MKDNQKKLIRERILKLLKTQKEDERLAKSLLILKKLFSLKEIKDSNIILFYFSFNGEVNTIEMIKKAIQLEKQVALPKIVGDNQLIPTMVQSLEQDLEMGPYGIPQPKEHCKIIDAQDLDIVVVPAVAFNRNNYRLGRGKGYYDQFLPRLSSKTSSIGLGFDFQIVDDFPVEDHDFPVSRVLINA